jgi:hypothetical protein
MWRLVAMAGAGLGLTLAGCALGGSVAHAAPAATPPAYAKYAPGRVLPRPLRYTPQQPMCHRSQAGEYAVMTGDGAPFAVRCDADGPRMWVWDAQS